MDPGTFMGILIAGVAGGWIILFMRLSGCPIMLN
jgi:hypothetical protein